MSQFNELEEIVGKSEEVTIDSKSFKVYELSIKDILSVFKKLGNLKIGGPDGIIKVITSNFDVAVELVACATKSPVNDVKSAVDNNKISLDGFTELTTKAIEVNSDVFLSAVEKVMGLSEKLNSQAKSLENKTAPSGA